MKNILRQAIPVLIVGGLLVANLLPLDGAKKPPQTEEKSPPPTEPQTAPEVRSVPTPVVPPQDSVETLDAILSKLPTNMPGRLFFLDRGALTILRRGRMTRIPIPDDAIVPAPVGQAVSPDGGRFALFSQRGGEFVVEIADLEPGRAPMPWSLAVPESGRIRWSPDSRELLVFTPTLVTLRMADGKVRELPVPEGVSDVIWSPDGAEVAIETLSGSILLFNRHTGVGSTIGGEAYDPVWGSRALLYLRRSAPGQVFWRRPEGEETGADLVEGEVWTTAKVLDLYYPPDSPLINFRPGSLPEEIKLHSLAPGAQPDSVIFTFQVDKPTTRYGVGKIVDAKLQLWLYPIIGGGPCEPGHLRDRPGGLFISAKSVGCPSDLVRVWHGEDRVAEIRQEPLLIDQTGTWAISLEDRSLKLSDLDKFYTYELRTIGLPVYWDGRE